MLLLLCGDAQHVALNSCSQGYTTLKSMSKIFSSCRRYAIQFCIVLLATDNLNDKVWYL